MKIINKYRLKEEIGDIVRKSMEKNIFSGACISFSKKDDDFKLKENYSFGNTAKFGNKTKVGEKTCFDLASLTKPMVTSLSLAVLMEKGKIDVDSKLSDCCGWFIPDNKKNIKISHLLSHSSGLPAHRPYYQELFDIPFKKKKFHLSTG